MQNSKQNTEPWTQTLFIFISVQNESNDLFHQGNADVYVPTFFTSQQNHAALSAARPNAFGSAVRNQRETGFEFESPLYRRPQAA